MGAAPARLRLRTASIRRADLCLGIFAGVAVIFFLTVGIGRPIWQDDANAVLMAKHDFAGIIDALRNDNNLPAYYLLLSVWIRIFGDSEPALRSLSAIFYLAGAVSTFFLSWSVYRHRRTALYSGLFFLASTQVIRQAQAVRMYSMLAALSAVSLLLFVRIFAHGSRSRGLYTAYLAVNSVGVLTQVWFFFVLLGQFAGTALWLRRDLKKFVAFLGVTVLTFGVLWGPIFLCQLHNGSTHWLPPFQPLFLADILLQFYGVQAGVSVFPLACIAMLALADRTAIRAFWQLDGTRILTLASAVCIVTPLAVSIVKPIYASGRYSTVALPALAALLGAVLTHFAPRVCGQGLCCAMLIASVSAHAMHCESVGETDLGPGQSDRSSAEYIVRHAAPGDAVVFTSLTRAAGDYYLHRFGADGRFVETSFPAELDRHNGWRDCNAMLRRPRALEAEAGELMWRLAGLSLEGKRIWLYYGGDRAVSAPLKRKLDAALPLVEEVHLGGPFHGRLLVYGVPQDAGSRAPGAMGARAN